MKRVLLSLVGMLLLFGGQMEASAQGTAFTYQGQLVDGGAPATGSYDFVFLLVDSDNAGNYLGSSVTNPAVNVTNGLFTVLLDFGPAFDGSARWLEIGVRSNGGSAFITLAPRQPLTPTPYAITASNALTAATISGPVPNGSLSGSYTGSVAFNNSSNVFGGSFTGNGNGLTNLPFAQTFSSTNGYFTFTQNVDGSTNVTFVFTNGTPGQVGAQPASSNLTLLAAGNGAGLTNLPYAETFASPNGYFTFVQNADGSTNVTFIFTNSTPGSVGAQPASSNLTALAGNNGSALTGDLRSLAVYVNSNYTVSASEVVAMQTTNIVYYIDTIAGNIQFTFPMAPASANVVFSLVNFGTNSITLTNSCGVFEIANGYTGIFTNTVTVGPYFDKAMVWQNFDATNWVQLANHCTVQEIQDLAAAYVGMANGNGAGLTNLNASNLASGTIIPSLLPANVLVTDGAAALGQVPTWNGTNYVWTTISAGGNIYSNTPVWFSSANTTNATSTNIFAGGLQIGGSIVQTNAAVMNTFASTINMSNALIESYPGCVPWTLVQRAYVTSLFPVATFRPLNPATPMAVDFMPNGFATDYGYGIAWNDICAVDCMTNNPLPLNVLHLAAHLGYAEISSVDYTAGPNNPLYFGYGSGNADVLFMGIFPNNNGANNPPQFGINVGQANYNQGGVLEIKQASWKGTNEAAGISIDTGTNGQPELLLGVSTNIGGAFVQADLRGSNTLNGGFTEPLFLNPSGGNVNIGNNSSTVTVPNNLVVNGLVTASHGVISGHFDASTNLPPIIAAGPGAGASPTVSISGSDSAGVITVCSGTLPTTSAVIATVTFGEAYTHNTSVVCWPANANASTLQFLPYVAGTSTNWTINAGTIPLGPSTTYQYNYQVVGAGF